MTGKYVYRKKFKARRRSIFKSRIFLFFLLILIFLSFFIYICFFHSFFNIKRIEILGSEKGRIEEIVQEEINKKILFLRAENIFLFNTEAVRKKIKNSFFEINSVSLKRKLPNSIEIIIEERISVANICIPDCYSLDKKGIIFEKAEEIKKPEIEILNLTEVGLGEKVIEEEKLKEIILIRESAKEIIPLDKIIISDTSKITAKTIEGWEIYFDSYGNIKNQSFNLNIVLNEKIPLEKRKDLEYIDLRFGDRVYFRYFQEESNQFDI